MSGILKLTAAGALMMVVASGALNRWPLDAEREADGLQKQMTDCDQSIDALMRYHDGEAEAARGDRRVVEGKVKICLFELKNYFYVTVARTRLKARRISSF
ncbi:hypothetical protein RHSP_70065 [Rhizobium freirei PRF 81]|uniref:Uncharacterized protein n=1 Tax=Rhizobium freirei PRF 81 TaxID=363754 RepID=N6UHF6_9HYPH|nr:hypothetical protein [Rhizobium freirei]ENN89678.1 hypothetical protein RHSP_70065 [Rhizobium freirei PRF 81]